MVLTRIGTRSDPVDPVTASDSPTPQTVALPVLARLGVGGCAALVIAVAFGLRAWVGVRGWFSLDDIRFVARALELPFSWTEAMTAYNGHLMPAAFAWVWATTSVAPWGFGLVIAVVLALSLATDVAFYRLLTSMFGRRPAILLPLAVYVLSPLTLPATVWWAAAMNQLPQQLATIAVVGCQVSYSRTGRTRTGLLGVAALVGGLAFSEKTLLAVPLAALLTLMYLQSGPAPRRVLTWLRQQAPVVIAYGVVCGAYLAYYVTHVTSPVTARAGVADWVNVTGSALVHAVLPGLVGGPWSWARIGLNDALAFPPPVLVAIVVVLLLVLVQSAALIGRRAVRAAVLFLGYAAAVLGLLVLTRAGIVGPLIARETRYLSDLALVGALCLALAFIPLVGEADVEQAGPRDPVSVTVSGWLRQLAHPVVGLCCVLALLASSAVSTVRFASIWASNPTRTYVQTARAQVGGGGTAVVLADSPAPASAMSGFQYPYTRPSAFLRPYPAGVRIMTPGVSTARLSAFDDSGHLRVAQVSQLATAAPGPHVQGSWEVADQAVTVPLTAALAAGEYVVRLGYLADRATDVVLEAGSTTATLPLQAGLGVVYVGVQGPLDAVSLRATANGASVSTNDIRVGVAFGPTGGAS